MAGYVVYISGNRYFFPSQRRFLVGGELVLSLWVIPLIAQLHRESKPAVLESVDWLPNEQSLPPTS